jgi:hypothetical protein
MRESVGVTKKFPKWKFFVCPFGSDISCKVLVQNASNPCDMSKLSMWPTLQNFGLSLKSYSSCLVTPCVIPTLEEKPIVAVEVEYTNPCFFWCRPLRGTKSCKISTLIWMSVYMILKLARTQWFWFVHAHIHHFWCGDTHLCKLILDLWRQYVLFQSPHPKPTPTEANVLTFWQV